MKKAVLNGKIIVVMLIFCGLSANARTIIRNESAPVPVCSGNQLSLKEVENKVLDDVSKIGRAHV